MVEKGGAASPRRGESGHDCDQGAQDAQDAQDDQAHIWGAGPGTWPLGDLPAAPATDLLILGGKLLILAHPEVVGLHGRVLHDAEHGVLEWLGRVDVTGV